MRADLLAKTTAPTRMSPSFANSDGWNWIGPIASQFWLPLTLRPNGMTAARSRIDMATIGKARRFHHRTSRRLAKPAATAPTTAKRSWRRKTV